MISDPGGKSLGGCLKESRVTTWGMLGVKGEWANQQIVALGQDVKSPAADFIKRTVQCRDEFHASVNIVNQAAIVEELSKNKYAVSFLNYAPDLPLKALALKRNDSDMVQLTAANVAAGARWRGEREHDRDVNRPLR